MLIDPVRNPGTAITRISVTSNRVRCKVRQGLFLKAFVFFVLSTLCHGEFVAQTVSHEDVVGQTDVESPELQVMEQFLSQYRGMTYDELCQLRPEQNPLVEKLSFNPAESRYYDRIKSKLKLTAEEQDVFGKHGLVSVDLQQNYSFGTAYYEIYSSHLPVFVTSDSILHALHRSFDDLLAELELSTVAPMLESILQGTHEALGSEEQASTLPDNHRDVDLYLTVARNLLARGTPIARPTKHKAEAQPLNALRVPSRFGQDATVLNILRLVDEGKIQIPGQSSTSIYGGKRCIDFSQFAPRGHYTSNARLAAYFRCMMWLSRADCGWFIQPADPTTTISNDPARELGNAALLVISLRNSGQQPQFESMNRLLAHFASQDDNLTVGKLDTVLLNAGIREVSDLTDNVQLVNALKDIGDNGLGRQMIRSQALFADGVSYTVQPPSLFQMFGQKFVIDSFVLSNVVYDSILFEDKKVRRYMPMGLDVMAALGNDEALLLLEPELRQYNYSANLMAASKFVDSCSTDFWNRDLYNQWLGSIRELDAVFPDTEHVPELMKTRAWQRKQLQTQLGSWSELRHDMVLYAKQSYTSVPGCEYPDGYVEPYPAFYQKLSGFAKSLQTAMLDLPKAGEDDVANVNSAGSYKKRIAYVARLISVLNQLQEIAETELRGDEMSGEQIRFLQQTIDRRGSLPLGSGSKPRFDGWYCDLFYTRDDVKTSDPTIIDVHTFPDSMGEPHVLEVGAGAVNLGVFAINCGDTSTAYVGPLYTYYEFQHPANDRLTDDVWNGMITGLGDPLARAGRRRENSPVPALPPRPEWTGMFRATPEKRTIDNVAIYMTGDGIQLKFALHNQQPETRSFAPTNAGLKELVNVVTSQKITDRISLPLESAQITPEILQSLATLENLVFVSLPRSFLGDPAIAEFRTKRPDVKVLPDDFQIVSAEVCDHVAGYQTFVARPEGKVTPGESVEIYAELAELQVNSAMFGREFSSSVDLAIELVDGEGQTLQEQLYSDLDETTPEFQVWPYRTVTLKISKDIPIGPCELRLRITDKLSNANPTASIVVPIEVVSQSK